MVEFMAIFIGCLLLRVRAKRAEIFLFIVDRRRTLIRSHGAAKSHPQNVGQNWRPPKIGGPVQPHTWHMPKADPDSARR